MTQAVFLDRATLAPSLDLSAIESLIENWQSYDLTTPAQVIERSADAEIIITNKVIFNAETLSHLPKLKLICVTATGTDNIDKLAAEKQQVKVMNVSDYSTNSVVQHLFAYLLNLTNNVPAYLKNIGENPWQNSNTFCQIDFPVNELAGSTLGIVGYGTLGRAVARVAEAFGMSVIIAERQGVIKVRADRQSFEQTLSQADIVSIHCPLTGDTEQLFNRDTLMKMKPGAILVNTARGGIVDPQALADSLQSGHLSHAIIDVLEQEPPAESHPLIARQLNNLTLTSHIAWGSIQAQKQLIEGVVANIKGSGLV